MKKIDKKLESIESFGEQWSNFTTNSGYYGSQSLLKDILAPLVEIEELYKKDILDLGAGTGRITNLLIEAGANHVYALEPSIAFNVLKENTKYNSKKITYINEDAEKIPDSLKVQIVMCIGVLHHIPKPIHAITSAVNALENHGKLIVWVYSKEGNRLYLSIISVVRLFTIKMSHKNLAIFCKKLIYPLYLYGKICKYLRLPMWEYMTKHINFLDKESLTITIYDQLNPTFSKYYTRREALDLLSSQPALKNIKIHKRHGYSYTLIGTKFI